MLNNFFKDQLNHNVNETNRINKLSKKVDNYENKKKYLLKNFDSNQLQKKINDIEKLNDFKNIDNVLLVNSNNPMYKKTNLDFLENVKNYNKKENKNEIIDVDDSKFNWEFLENVKKYGESYQLNKHIRCINLVYQYIYFNNEPVTGFGDFIRCCFFIIQFSERYHTYVDFHINDHPIKNYLSYFENKLSLQTTISKNTPFLKINNYVYKTYKNTIIYKYKNIDTILISYINSLQIYNGNVYTYLINHPDESLITNDHKIKLAEILAPNDYLNNRIIDTMNGIKLNVKKFKVIHLRFEDDDYHKNIINRTAFILYIIRLFILNKDDDDIFLISNKNFIKTRLTQLMPNIKTIIHNTSHTACRETNDNENIINTLKEFYIMSKSNYIYSFSVYRHGSGFSKWCAVTYNIPYVCFFLQ
jgi:hypothetical protein